MKISSKVQCGIVALIDIAMNSSDNTAVTVFSISERQKISPKYLEQILMVLKQAKIIKGIKGSKGGYLLAKNADKILFTDILNALDVTILSDDFDENEEDSPVIETLNTFLWNRMNNGLKEYAGSISLQNAVDRCNETISEKADNFMYYI